MFRKLKCQHLWEEVSRTVTQGIIYKQIDYTGFVNPVTELQRLAAGQTHIELRCSRCHDITSRTLNGIHKK